ncbi:unnamed protein product [Nezara viridula]|uniref:Uncharacterized protein n=1 Tax=Nezara viridula TaxID=85310 RepID=A0A9P0HDY7_NEZVI|nr:unnamed protein product [Nezara viridula]
MCTNNITCCQFYPIGEYLRFVRVPESLEIGSEILLVEVHPRRNLSIQPVDLGRLRLGSLVLDQRVSSRRASRPRGTIPLTHVPEYLLQVGVPRW